jgi:hypothetical protein
MALSSGFYFAPLLSLPGAARNNRKWDCLIPEAHTRVPAAAVLAFAKLPQRG